jgi:hypothetical protein
MNCVDVCRESGLESVNVSECPCVGSGDVLGSMLPRRCHSTGHPTPKILPWLSLTPITSWSMDPIRTGSLIVLDRFSWIKVHY